MAWEGTGSGGDDGDKVGMVWTGRGTEGVGTVWTGAVTESVWYGQGRGMGVAGANVEWVWCGPSGDGVGRVVILLAGA